MITTTDNTVAVHCIQIHIDHPWANKHTVGSRSTPFLLSQCVDVWLCPTRSRPMRVCPWLSSSYVSHASLLVGIIGLLIASVRHSLIRGSITMVSSSVDFLLEGNVRVQLTKSTSSNLKTPTTTTTTTTTRHVSSCLHCSSRPCDCNVHPSKLPFRPSGNLQQSRDCVHGSGTCGRWQLLEHVRLFFDCVPRGDNYHHANFG